MRIFLFLLILCACKIVNSQTTNKTSDTTLVLGKLINDEYILSDAFVGTNLPAGAYVIVNNINVTKNGKERSFDVIYNNKLYNVRCKNVMTAYKNAYDEILEFTPDQIKRFQDRSWSHAQAAKQLEISEALKFVSEKKTYGLLMLGYSVLKPRDYEIGTGLFFSILNPTRKTIKYVWFTVSAVNPVDDIISTKTVRGVGPIYKENSAVWKFEDVWFSDLIDHVRIKQIKVQYMDGTVKIISKPDAVYVPSRFSNALRSDF